MSNKITFYSRILALSLALALTAAPQVAEAQCPMCRMSAESNLKNGGTDGRGLNNGILYMLATPYMIIGVIGFMWWRNRRKEGEDDLVLED